MNTPKSSPFLNPVRTAIGVRHYSIRTGKAYVDWIKRFIHFHDCKHLKDLAEPEVVAFLSDLAVSSNLAESTQNQALNALCFLYKKRLEGPLGKLRGAVRAKLLGLNSNKALAELKKRAQLTPVVVSAQP